MYIESVNKEICDKLINMSFKDFIDFMKFIDSNYETDDAGELIWIESQYNMIKSYCKYMKSNNYTIQQEYKYSNGNNGRLFVKNKNGGLQRINKYIRGVLCDGIYTDIDMVCAHQNLLRYICNKHNISCKYLTLFCMDREIYYDNLIKELKCNRETVKILFIKSFNSKNRINSVNINNKLKYIKDKFFINYDNEMKDIQHKLMNKYTNIKQDLLNQGKYNNIEGRLLNTILCILENDILTDIKNHNIVNLNVLMFDGFMTSSNIDNNIIQKLNDITAKYYIKWSIKPHNTILKQNILNLENNSKLFFCGNNNIEIAQNILKDYLNDYLCYSNDTYWYNNNTIYINNEKTIKRELFNFIVNNDVYIIDVNKQYISIKNSKKSIDEIVTSILNLCERKNNFMDEIWNDTLYKLYFKNGYYDFVTDKFETDITKFKTTNYINYELNMTSNKEIREDIFKKIFYPIFGINNININKDRYQLMEYFLYRLARSIAGHIEDKKWIVLRGLRNCGKGVISDLLKNTFEFYVGITNSGNFIYKYYDSIDEAKMNAWITDFIYCRLAITQEITLSKNKYIDGNKIKQFASGGDIINARTNFKDAIQFKVQSTLMMCCNDLPSIKPNDCLETCDEFFLLSKFINKNEISDEMKLSNVNYYPKINNIKKELLQNQYIKNEFVLLLIDYYKRIDISYPDVVIDDYDDNNEIKKIKDNFLQGNINDPNCFVSNYDIKELLDKLQVYMSEKKFNTIITGMFNCKNGKKHKIRGYFGIDINE